MDNAAFSYADLNQQLDKAEEYTNEALNIFSRLGEKRIIGGCYNTYGVIYHKKNEWNKSSECFDKAIKIHGKIESLEILSQTYFFYGKMFDDKSDKEKARGGLRSP